MVFYTCSGCGESLKKNKVENHCYSCRNCEYLTCIDCNKDFYGDDYKFHTSCMTENEKYSAKGTEFKPNKGEVKQQQWLQNIDSVMSSGSNFSLKAQSLIKTLSNYDNIPRKKAKFLNFLKNSLRIYDTALGEEIYGAFSSANNKTTKATAENEAENTTTEIEKTQNQAFEEPAKTTSDNPSKDEELELTDNKLKKKSKKRKKESEDTENQFNSSEISGSPKKKKKKDKTSEANMTEIAHKKKQKEFMPSNIDGLETNGTQVTLLEKTQKSNMTENNNSPPVEKIKKSHKKKRKDIEAMSLNIDCEATKGTEVVLQSDVVSEKTPETNHANTNGITVSQEKTKKKKHKKRDREKNGEIDNSISEKEENHDKSQQPDSASHDVAKKKKKKSSKLNIDDSAKIETTTAQDDVVKKKKHKKSKPDMNPQNLSDLGAEIENCNSVKTHNNSNHEVDSLNNKKEKKRRKQDSENTPELENIPKKHKKSKRPKEIDE